MGGRQHLHGPGGGRPWFLLVRTRGRKMALEDGRVTAAGRQFRVEDIALAGPAQVEDEGAGPCGAEAGVR